MITVRLIGSLLILFLVAGGCSAAGPQNEESSIAKIQAEITYKLVLPAVLPKGYYLDTAEVLDVPGKQKTDVRLTYRGPGGAVLIVEEAPYPIGINGEPLTRLEELGDVDVQYVSKGGILLLTFLTEDGVGVSLKGMSVPEADFLAIVKSMLHSK